MNEPRKLEPDVRETLIAAHRILVQNREDVVRAISALHRLEMSAPSAEVARRVALAILAEYEPDPSTVASSPAEERAP